MLMIYISLQSFYCLLFSFLSRSSSNREPAFLSAEEPGCVICSCMPFRDQSPENSTSSMRLNSGDSVMTCVAYKKYFVLTSSLSEDDAMSNPKEIVPSWRGRFEQVSDSSSSSRSQKVLRVASSSVPEILNRANVKLVCVFGLAVGSRSQEVERSEHTSPASA